MGKERTCKEGNEGVERKEGERGRKRERINIERYESFYVIEIMSVKSAVSAIDITIQQSW